MLSPKSTKTLISFVKIVVPVFGAASLFWATYTAKIPDTLKLLLSLSDAGQLLAPLGLIAVTSGFFGRLFVLFVHYNLTVIRDITIGRTSQEFRLRNRKKLFYINFLRRFLRKYDVYISAAIATMLFCSLVFDGLPVGFLITTSISSFLIALALRVFLFRTQNHDTYSYFFIPKGVSSTRLSEFRLSWLALSALLFSITFGIELFEYRLEQTACLETHDDTIETGVLVVTDDFIIAVQKDSESVQSYFAVPVSEVVRIDTCGAKVASSKS